MTKESAQLEKFSFLHGGNTQYIGEMYDKFKQDPASVDETWQFFFKGYEFSQGGDPSFQGGGRAVAGASRSASQAGGLDAKVESYINFIRKMGHLSANLNPLEAKPELHPELKPEAYGLGQIPGDKTFLPANLPVEGAVSFQEIFSVITETYCREIGAEIRDVTSIEALIWFQDKMESCRNKPELAADDKMNILTSLIRSEGFERFLQDRYIGQKRFSVEGLEALLPLMDTIAEESGKRGAEEICMGMAHRGRLNVLANFLGKPYELMLKEFEDLEEQSDAIDGDVKYHMGFTNKIKTNSGDTVRVYLAPNPSHLEAVNPVVEGFTRARQRAAGDLGKFGKILPVLIHGDAAFIGQGLVAETLNLSKLDEYQTGGTIHVITNNQIGYTTNPKDSRSSAYSSDVARMVRAPVLHVNADDPEAVVWTAKLAVAYRQKFHGDIVIDLIGYRRHGHNEGDEPSFTQPTMYKTIKKHATVLTRYAEKLIGERIITKEQFDAEKKAFRASLQECLNQVRAGNITAEVKVPDELVDNVIFKRVPKPELFNKVDTKIPAADVVAIAQQTAKLPEGFTPHPKVTKLMKNRLEMVEGEGSIDWGLGEMITYGSLVKSGTHVRMSGQDCERGTFGHRHAVVFDYETGNPLELLNQIPGAKERADIINSPLSEQGVLGFEFGFTAGNPKALVMWEAQFGDFCNGAQIIIDQFLAASEAKWQQCSSLVMLLPHGHEGAGPEHSSARPERFLQLCGNSNMQIANVTSPAQFFHILRRQVVRDFNKPLIIMTPKMLLRYNEARSTIKDFSEGCFEEVLDDAKVKVNKNVTRLVFCTGKIYYEMDKVRSENAKETAGVGLIRFEQLYPFPEERVEAICKKYKNVTEYLWVQEEPSNLGAWTFIRHRIKRVVLTQNSDASFGYIGRKSAGTTAEGSKKVHGTEQQRIIKAALGLNGSQDPDFKA